MYCVIQEIERSKENMGRPKSIETFSYEINGETVYAYRRSGERFERPIKKAYKISLHESYREDGKVKKKQYSICTMGYYDILEYGLYDFADGKIKILSKKLNVSTEYIYNLVYEKLDILESLISMEYGETEEYKEYNKQIEIIKKYNEAKYNFEKKYESNKFDRCYDVFLNLRNADQLEKVKKEYEENQEYKRRSEEQQRRFYKEYFDSDYFGRSGYQEKYNSNYNDDERKLLKEAFRMLSMKYHPDKGGSTEKMALINNLKEKIIK